MGRCSRRHHATAAARWRPSWIGWGSASSTPVRTILRPAARSSGFHQTLKRWLLKQEPARTLAELQAALDRFRAYYGAVRPHRAIGRRTPELAFNARPKAAPALPGFTVLRHFRVRRDKIDITGVITLRHDSRLHHIGLGRALTGTRVLVLVDDLRVRVLSEDGELIRELTLDPARDY